MKHARKDYNRIQDPEGLIPENEPVFLLRGKDVLAPGILREYAVRTIKAGGDQLIAENTLQQAIEMDKYQSEFGNKLADMPENQ